MSPLIAAPTLLVGRHTGDCSTLVFHPITLASRDTAGILPSTEYPRKGFSKRDGAYILLFHTVREKGAACDGDVPFNSYRRSLVADIGPFVPVGCVLV